jgi:hypothetical protein
MAISLIERKEEDYRLNGEAMSFLFSMSILDLNRWYFAWLYGYVHFQIYDSRYGKCCERKHSYLGKH